MAFAPFRTYLEMFSYLGFTFHSVRSHQTVFILNASGFSPDSV